MRYVYSPLALPFIILFFIFILFFLLILQLGVSTYAFYRLGFTPMQAFQILFLSLIGSFINIPVKEIKTEVVYSPPRVVTFFGIRYIIPAIKFERKTIIAVNFGGAVVPTIVSIYLLMQDVHLIKAILGISAVAIISYIFARPIQGLGIAVPAFIPPIVSALIALILDPTNAPKLAYICGTLGVLIGADILNLRKVHKIGAPLVSIGGAGTFDGIFLTGIFSVFIVTLF